MAYIGKQPTVGNFVKLDAITATATTTFNLLNGGVAYSPQSPNHCLVSLNGILQAPTDSFTISGSTIIFSSALTTSDVIDFIIVLGDVLNIGTPSDNTVSLAKLTATGTKSATTFLRGDNTFQTIGVNTPAFSVSLATGFNATANTYTKISYATVEFDTANEFNTTNNYYKITETGKYLIQIQIRLTHTTNAQEYHGVSLYKDTNSAFSGESQIAFQRMLTAYGNQTYNPEFNHQLNDIMTFTSGDYLRVKVYNGSGSARGISGNDSGQPRSTTWSMHKLIGV